MNKTNVMRILDKAKIPYTPYYYVTEDGKIDGVSVAQKMGQDPATVFKTLVAISKTKELFVFIIPVARELDLKKAAMASAQKNMEMLPQSKLLPMTGYIHGGCSPVGMKKQYATFLDQSARDCPEISVSGGKVGAQVRQSPDALLQISKAVYADLTREK